VGKLNKEKLQIAILGPGAIGSFLAALLWKSGHNVVCVGNSISIDKINKSGITFESKVYGNFTATPSAVVTLDKSVDVLFISVKAVFLKDAIRRISENWVRNSIVIPILNGIGNREVINDRFGGRVAVGTIGMIEVSRSREGVIRHLSSKKPHIEIASDFGISQQELNELSCIINMADIPLSLVHDEASVIWKKLARLNVIASLTTAYHKTVGEIRDDTKINKLMIEMVEESVLVAGKEGVDIKSEDVIYQINSLPEKLTTSMQRDVAAGRVSEIESITGGVLRLAESYNVPVPVHKYIYEMINKDISTQKNKLK
jgi:2-dehydropantoate 2-reductase